MPGSVSSQGSHQSIQKSLIACPHCQKEVQGRYIFHHIRVHHITEFLSATQRKWIAEAEAGRPLKVFWETKNDFDEIETKIVYGCLSSDKCFMTEERGIRHFKHNPDHLKKHNRELKKLKKEFELKKKREEAERKKNPQAFALQKAMMESDPLLVEGLWRGMFHWKNACDLAVRIGSFPDDYLYISHYAPREAHPWPTIVEKYRQKCLKAKAACQNNSTDCSLLSHLYNFFWDFLMRFKNNCSDLGQPLDPRLDDRNPEAIVVWRDESVLSEELFFMATKEMPLPTPDQFDPPPPLPQPAPPPEQPPTPPEPEVPVALPGLTKQVTARVVKQFPPNTKEFNSLFTSIRTGEIVKPPQAVILENYYLASLPLVQNSKVRKAIPA